MSCALVIAPVVLGNGGGTRAASPADRLGAGQAMAAQTGPRETIVDLVRLKALTDGVYAIALTLLVLEIRIPENTLVGELSSTLVGLAPRVLIYLISFFVIGGAWGSHQRMFSQIRRGDGLLVWFNFLSLLFVTLVPASAAL